jgi:tRNA(Leu) C34 or U34 (ribose-2'-O)-methylase TrmL
MPILQKVTFCCLAVNLEGFHLILEENPGSRLKLPMHKEVRSLNLASTVNTVAYEAIRQFGGL